ncbi:phosphate ABC transporter substrate-binding protein PstS [Nocardioides sp. TRM66260-LWL]|uniref:phosphate ABC transporter substrate-binding protein PstS n=1 Tax=Nocardioides sp. TRM66260-LWL TaxID=2874478 RepID=UPI001CC7D8D9|nr:phosphate ABC transporter substrate-binding protein PstS [Nocardioides sp. TRM66260-LWL]MBZ5734778.1 phosphate ABC transporter substrate-binding protein PstS [Nocardioides sp. TRM66260-LWL]
MIRSSIRRGLVPGVAALALALSACGAGNDTSSAGDGASGGSGLSGQLNGGGATSQEKAQEAWRAGFQSANSGVTVNYDGVGSGDGRKNFISGAFAFAGTDSAINDDEGELSAAAKNCASDVVQVPGYVSPIAVAFNLPGITSLNLSADVITGIFDGSITQWNDPKIAAENDGVQLPDTKIVPVHRSDKSGTTKNFTDYLSKAGGWKPEADDTWPSSVSGGEAAKGTSGVVGLITDNEGYVGYADNSAVADLGKASIKVGDAFVAPSEEGAAKALSVSKLANEGSKTDLAYDIDRTTTEADAYPLILVSYLLACQSYADADTGKLVKAYFEYIVSDEGQKAAEAQAGSAPLDATVAEKAQAIVAGITTK